jgi:hypothetical protein
MLFLKKENLLRLVLISSLGITSNCQTTNSPTSSKPSKAPDTVTNPSDPNTTGSTKPEINDLSPQTYYVFEIVAVNEAGESNKAGIQVRTYIPSSSGGSGFVSPANPATSGSVTLNGGYN